VVELQFELQQSYGEPHGCPVDRQQRRSPASPSPIVFAPHPPMQHCSSVVHAQPPALQRLPSAAVHDGLALFVTHTELEHEPLQHS
jgi:hypothetical protein